MITGEFDGLARSPKPPDLAWHARGQGFKSPQLHAGRCVLADREHVRPNGVPASRNSMSNPLLWCRGFRSFRSRAKRPWIRPESARGRFRAASSASVVVDSARRSISVLQPATSELRSHNLAFEGRYGPVS